MKKNLLVALILLCVAGCSTPPSKDLCQTNCITPYGMVTGESTGEVKAYSNCQSGCVNYEPNIVDGVYTGIKWQCVEYARRWLLIHKGAVYGDVEVAADIWDKVDHLNHVATNTKIPLKSYLNGSKHPPMIGDLLIYARAFHNTGHVAVVTKIDQEAGLIEVGEQNFNNELWHHNYSRRIPFIKVDERYWLLDGYLLGWKHIVG